MFKRFFKTFVELKKDENTLDLVERMFKQKPEICIRSSPKDRAGTCLYVVEHEEEYYVFEFDYGSCSGCDKVLDATFSGIPDDRVINRLLTEVGERLLKDVKVFPTLKDSYKYVTSKNFSTIY